jgi:hypothetical protein
MFALRCAVLRCAAACCALLHWSMLCALTSKLSMTKYRGW